MLWKFDVNSMGLRELRLAVQELRHCLEIPPAEFIRMRTEIERLQAIVAKLPAWASRIEEANEGLLTVFTSDWRAVLTTVAREMEAAQAAGGGE